MSAMLMPKLSDTMEEGTVLRWLRADGDVVAKGEPLVEIETDKATMTVDAPVSGTLSIVAAEGETLDIGQPIAEIGGATDTPDAGESRGGSDPGATGTIAVPGVPTQEIPTVRDEDVPATGIPTADDGTASSIASAVTPTDVSAAAGRHAASPLARSIAARGGVDLADVAGTGPGGRIVKADVEAVLAGAPAPVPPSPQPPETGSAPGGPDAWPAGRRTPLTRLQRTISRRMDEANAIPVFTLERDVDTTALAAARADLRLALPEGKRPGVNDFVIRAVAMAVRERPDMVSHIDGDDVVVPASVDVGVAVAVPGGLLVPVIRNADAKEVPAIAAEVHDLATRGRARDLRPDELEGSVISVSNLGMFGIDRFHAVVNPGEAAILAVGRAVPKPVVVDGQVVVRDVMTLSLSVDHRIAYGAEAATFLSRVAELLEHPAALLV